MKIRNAALLGVSALAAAFSIIGTNPASAATTTGGGTGSGTAAALAVTPALTNGEKLLAEPIGTGYQRWTFDEFAGTMGDGWFCLNSSPDYCALANNLNQGTPIVTENDGTADTAALWVPIVVNNVCDGQSSCGGVFYPFTNHSFDKTYNGDVILKIFPPNITSHVGLAEKSGKAIISAFGTNDSLWVGTVASLHNGYLMSVAKTNSGGLVSVLTAPSP
jgi:hypothetical protein